MIVADASVLVDAFIGDAAAAARLEGEEIHAPHLVDVEVASALRRLESGGAVAESQAARLIEALRRADIHRHPHEGLLKAIWELRGTLTPYDAAYVTLATVLDAPLVTADRRLAAAAGLTCPVEVVGG